ncbi:hypothetical protein SAY87_010971 [Trapa incisa]|uniref:Uncharacterized protein n=1 Tax=Trapa incisa TaxID=236973 RepID=A0AAN7GVI3_9MYRT|nr:hypothetical protein SAY87_010971 [Trapa incisa]
MRRSMRDEKERKVAIKLTTSYRFALCEETISSTKMNLIEPRRAPYKFAVSDAQAALPSARLSRYLPKGSCCSSSPEIDQPEKASSLSLYITNSQKLNRVEERQRRW